MTTTSAAPGVAPRGDAPTPGPSRRSGRWIDDWRPEDPEFWNESGRKVARLNLIWSIFAATRASRSTSLLSALSPPATGAK